MDDGSLRPRQSCQIHPKISYNLRIVKHFFIFIRSLSSFVPRGKMQTLFTPPRTIKRGKSDPHDR